MSTQDILRALEGLRDLYDADAQRAYERASEARKANEELGIPTTRYQSRQIGKADAYDTASCLLDELMDEIKSAYTLNQKFNSRFLK